jgi:RNA polymerase sigma factor (sigma-70 family)
LNDAPVSDDAELMLRVQRGHEASFATLMSRWELPVKAVIGRIVLNSSEAEDLAQETFVRVWQQREKFRAGAELRPWIFAIAVNLARNRLRWWRRRPAVSLDDWSSDDAVAAELVSNAPGSREKLQQAERAQAVQAAIAALPLELREAVVLFEYEHLSHAEIAQISGTSAKAIEARLYRAREKLRAALKAWA